MKKAGTIIPKPGTDGRIPYEHQRVAMAHLDLLDKESSFSTMVVLPTGGGKTYTAVNWLLRRAVNKGRKVLWVAHRHMLLDQAAESFEQYAYASAMPDVSAFTYRIVSGSKEHATASSINRADDVVVASKDSLRSRLDYVTEWLSGQDEAYLVVDEAHHATAKTYRRLIDEVVRAVPHLKIIGLTATPMRTLESEQGLLARIFKDGVVGGRVVKGQVGIACQIGLQELINRLILARPRIEACQTNESFGDQLGAKEIEEMRRLDRIPQKVAEQMVANRSRNRLIVSTYASNREKYGKTILFAVNINHAVSLQELFTKAGVESDIVVSSLKDDDTGRIRTPAENDAAIARYRDGDLEVLINVNILTEGVDLPKTKSVFLTRPTSSTIMMTQMVGRALRGTKAGGTAECYIVTFVDGWDERVAWVNPSTLYSGEAVSAEEDRKERERTEVRTIAISMIREFAQILDNAVDTNFIEAIPFLERIPLGMYMFTYTEQGDDEGEGSDVSCQVMVYSSTKDAFERFIDGLHDLTAGQGLEDAEYAPEDVVEKLTSVAERRYFDGDFVPPYRTGDLSAIIRYYVQFGVGPAFYPFDEIDRNQLDVGAIARTIVDKGMPRTAEQTYLNQLWNEGDENILRMLFSNKSNFLHAVDTEVNKILYPEMYASYLPKRSTGDADPSGEGPIDVEPVSSDIVGAGHGEAEPVSFDEVFDDGASQDADDASLQVVSGRRVNERISRAVAQLHPDEERLASMKEYKPQGFAVAFRSGMKIRKFGGKAREAVDGGRLALYSMGYRVAELDPDGRVHLLAYSLDGLRRGWDSSKETINHVGDFSAFHLELDRAPSKASFEEMAKRRGSRVLVSHVDVIGEKPMDSEEEEAESKASGPVATASLTSAAQSSEYGVAGKATSSVAGGTAGAGTASAESDVSPSSATDSDDADLRHRVDNASSPEDASSGSAVDVPSRISVEDFRRLKTLTPSGKINYRANTPYTTFNGRARLYDKDGCTYLYAKGLNTAPILIAKWAPNGGGLSLFEYDRGKGWFDRDFSAFSRDFATQLLETDHGMTTIALRKASDNIAKPITIIYAGNPVFGALEIEAGDETEGSNADSMRNAEAVPTLNAAHKAAAAKNSGEGGGTPRREYVLLYKNNRREKVPLSEISCIRHESRGLCLVYTAKGRRYTLNEGFAKAVERFVPKGFVKVNVSYLVRPAMIESLTGDVTKEAEVKGVPMRIFVPDSAYQKLVDQFWGKGGDE